MLHFVMLLLTSQPGLPPPDLALVRLPFLSAGGCEAAAAAVSLPPGLRLACVPVAVPEAAMMAGMRF